MTKGDVTTGKEGAKRPSPRKPAESKEQPRKDSALAKEMQGLLKKSGMTFQEFAQKIGVREYTVERWLRGQSHPSPLARKAIELLLESKKKDNGS